MSVFDTINKTSGSALDHGKKYADTSIKYIKLKTFHITALTISMVTNFIIIGSFLLLAIVFLGISLAMFLSDYFESAALGFLSVGALFTVVAIFIALLKNSIDGKIIRSLGSKFYEEEEEENSNTPL